MAGAVAVFAAGRVPAPGPVQTVAASEAPTSPTPTSTPLTASERLLAAASDPRACAVSFAGDGIADEPRLETEGTRYEALPLPRVEGRVFAGWYPTVGDAAALTAAARVNGADLVACTARQRVLHAGWTTPAANAAEDARIPILMYHQFTERPEGEDTWLRGNYAYVGDFEAQMAYIRQADFYLPTWDELSAFIDGALFLPKHSVVITDDDADPTWVDLAAPVVAHWQLLTTSFVITSARTDPAPNAFVQQRSHTHDMHRAGANGKGRMVNEDAETIAADLEQSARILGAKEVVAYPYGHSDETAREGVRRAGFEMARTIEPGRVRIGTDKLALPVVRIDYGMTADDLRSAIG